MVINHLAFGLPVAIAVFPDLGEFGGRFQALDTVNGTVKAMNADGQGAVASRAVDLQAAFHQFSVEHVLLIGKITLKSCIVIGVIS